jgi:hypothetical protein
VIGAGLVVAAPANAAPVADVAALRQAVSDLNGTGPADEIELAPGITYSLPGAGGCDNEDNNVAGDLDVRRSQPLKIFTPDGQQPAILEMTCDQEKEPQRVLDVQGIGAGQAGKLTLRNIVIKNGHAPAGTGGNNFGGGVLATGDVAIENTTFENNIGGDGLAGNTANPAGGVGGFGGAVIAGGVVTIVGSTFTGNRAGAGGNGLGGNDKACDGGLGGQGGAVLALAGLTITNSTLTGNTAGTGGNGGDGRCVGDAVRAGSGGDGGSGGAVQCGILLTGSGTSGQSRACAGATTVRTSTFSGNVAGGGGKGGTGVQGGIGGSGGSGGAIMFVGNPDVTASTLLMENSTVDGNSSGSGGAGGDGGNAGDGGRGGQAGAIAAGFTKRGGDNQVARLVHVTITENGGGTGGKAGQPDVLTPALAAAGTPGLDGATGGGGVAMFDEWTSVSTVIGTSTEGDGPDCWRPATNPSFSVATDADQKTGCGFGPGSVLPFAGFALGALADNGGPTKTRLPAAASTLVDKIAVAPDQLTADQRGVGRPQAGTSDIGAVELQLIDLAVTKTASASTVAAGTAVTFTVTAKNSGTSSPRPGVTVEDPNCGTMSTASGDGNTNDTLDPGETFTYTCSATPTEAGTFTNTVTATVTDAAGVKINRTASVDVTVTGGGIPPLAKTGANNPTLELVTGATLVFGGVVLVLATRPRRVRVRENLK